MVSGELTSVCLSLSPNLSLSFPLVFMQDALSSPSVPFPISLENLHDHFSFLPFLPTHNVCGQNIEVDFDAWPRVH